MTFQHAVRGADKVIPEAIAKHLIGHERARELGSHSASYVLSCERLDWRMRVERP
jgi:hypothetical protein